MTSKIKVDNIENQCGGAVVTKCGGTTTISGTVVKSNTLQASDAGNIISQSGTTITLGASGDTINLASGASQSGFGRTGTVDWITTPKTTGTFTAVSGEGYFLNTSGGVITANLPAGVAGAIVSFADYAETWQTNNVTVTPNGTDKIGSLNQNATLNIQGQSVTLVFVDSTQGWINTMDSTSNVRGVIPSVFICASVSGACNTLATVDTDYKVATFTGPGNFTVNAGSGAVAVVDYLIVAGGGGGGNSHGAGGGAGGFRESHVDATSGPYTASPLAATSSLPVSVQAYGIVVGAGGAAPSNPGSVSTFSTITSAGGGGGATEAQPSNAGGSGGGATYGSEPGGIGNTPPVSPPQGQSGGSGTPSGTPYHAGGGGGAGTTGSDYNVSDGKGGDGVTTSINNSSVTRAGGGGAGGTSYGQPAAGAGGPGGGGAGSTSSGSPGTNGTVNTGGGAGGAFAAPVGTGGTGGSGIVIIRYKFQ